MAKKTVDPTHRWNFFQAGGVDQVRLDSGADLAHLGELDLKLWVALSCPVHGLEFDERTLSLLDTDKDGHVRAPELIAAAKWTCALLKNPDDLMHGRDGLPLAAINASAPDGKEILASAKHILASLGKKDAGAITIADAMNTVEIFARAKHNGDGIVPPEFIADDAARQTAIDVITCLGGETSRSGKVGISQAKLDQFFTDAKKYVDWWQQAETQSANVLPLGDKTPAAFAAYQAVRAKVDDFFARCRLAAYDPRALQAVNRKEEGYLEIAAGDLSITMDEIAHFPLAIIEAAKPLAFDTGINPAWSKAMADLRQHTIVPLLGSQIQSLGESDWTNAGKRLAAYEVWARDEPGASVKQLGHQRLREILAGSTQAVLVKHIQEDLAVAPQIDAMTNVEKLARYYRDLQKLARNFVSFIDFYSRQPSIFQAGSLYLDGRTCDLCVRVLDPGKHAVMAVMAKTYLAYVDCTRPGESKMTVACAFTAGDSDNLFVGRNGIFYDRKGRDWDATVTKIVDNPISIGQAFWAPYKKVLRAIETAAAKRAAAADEATSTRLITSIESTAATAPAPAATIPMTKFDVGVVAALGVAVGGITAALTGLLQAFFGLGAWMPVGVIGLLLLISGPSLMIAWLKLRQRNLGPILDANGWAVNALTRVNIQLGDALTSRAVLPAGSSRSLVDPYAPKKSMWPYFFLALVILGSVGFALYQTGHLHEWLPNYIPDPRK